MEGGNAWRTLGAVEFVETAARSPIGSAPRSYRSWPMRSQSVRSVLSCWNSRPDTRGWPKISKYRATDDRTNDLRSMEQALADIVEKYNQMPDNSRERSELERMIGSLEAEIARRRTRGG